jgi:penicillin-binding protein 2
VGHLAAAPIRGGAQVTAADPRRLRLGILAVVVGSLFTVLLARMWHLQVLSGDESRLATGRNAVRTLAEQAPRGRILSRDGVVLVDNRPSDVVAVDRSSLDADEEAVVLQRLAPLLGVPPEVLAERLADPTADPLLPVPVADDVGDEAVIRLREAQDALPGVVLSRVARRTFPEGALAAHLLGHLGQIDGPQLAARAGEGYVAGDLIGRSGVELAFEADLRGEDGRTTVEVDATGRPVRVVASEPARPGADVVLSIDAAVQRVVERSLADGLVAARGQPFADDRAPLVADAGAAVVLDVDDGSVVAIASYPTFDPEVFTDGLTSAELDALADPAAGTPQLDRAVTGFHVEPGA